MGAPACSIPPVILQNDEGEIRVIIGGGKKPSKKDIDALSFDSGFILIHEPYCGGMLKAIQVSDSKRVLFCDKCGLRLSIACDVKTLGAIRKAISQ